MFILKKDPKPMLEISHQLEIRTIHHANHYLTSSSFCRVELDLKSTS